MIKSTSVFLVTNLLVIVGTIHLVGNLITMPIDIFIVYIITRTIIGVYVASLFTFVIRKQQATENLKFLALAGLLFILSYFLETYAVILRNTTDSNIRDISKILFNLAQIGITTAPLPFMYFVISFFKDETNMLVFMPVILDSALETVYQPTGETVAVISFDIKSQVIDYWIYQPTSPWITLLYFLSILWLVLYLWYLIYISRKRAIEPAIKEQQDVFFIGIFTIFILSPLIFTLNYLIQHTLARFYWLAIVNRSFVVLGMIIFIYAYYRSSKKLDFFQPQPLETLFLLDARTGEILYKKKFQLNFEGEILDGIVTNLTMINKMLSDALGIDSLITGIDFIDKELIVNTLHDLDIISILVVTYHTRVIQENYEQLLSDVISTGPSFMDKIETIVDSNFRF